MSRLSSNWFPWNGSIPQELIDQKSQIIPALSKPISPKKQRANQEQFASEKDHSQSKTLKNKASSISLSSMSAGMWLKWGKKADMAENSNPIGTSGNGGSSGNYSGNNHGADNNNDSDNNDSNNNNNNSDDEDEDFLPDDNGDEVEENASQKTRKKLWSFWNSLEEYQKDTRVVSTANTILNSTTTFPTPEDTKKSDTEDAVTDSNVGDDAVLYKPHNSAKQFNKINTHKNENIYENIIVPRWETCIKPQDKSLSSSTSQPLYDADQRNGPFDIKNWRGYLSYISSRFGFGSSHVSSALEKEFRDSNEHSYHLYGKTLNLLPPSKRACLPNFGFYHCHGGDPSTEIGSQNNDETDHSVAVNSDIDGNFSINPLPTVESQNSTYAAVFSQPLGPLVKIKKILIIGVHGFFPTRMIRPLIGAPKGTSLKFANEAEKAIIRYCLENGMLKTKDTSTMSIQKIALEKEGKIFDRVAFFLEILTKWEKELNEVDFIFIAAHSQGCVVSIILLAQLIKRGILKNPIYKRIGILGMAGVNNGPFYGVDKSLFMKAYSAIEHDSLLELFELNKFGSPQSVAYKQSMQILVNANVKVCLIGSINDLLVPLYSALASHVFHPNIYRACYIDRSSNTPNFIARLVSICCQLQNLGYFDNNVIRELSTNLAGPITGGGHSKIYNDGKVYDLGIKFTLDTDDLVVPDMARSGNEQMILPINNHVHTKEYNVGKLGTNPFILPWCLRGLIFNVEKNWMASDAGQKSGSDEVRELYELFDEWKPVSKILRDLKFRLSGIRNSKL